MHFKISYSSGESSFSYEINSSEGDLDAIFIGLDSFINTIIETDETEEEEIDKDHIEPV
tara:strand:+ start:1065 stop:1241 length:177 start_codon:yes stop_codon:yes gene_type:complete